MRVGHFCGFFIAAAFRLLRVSLIVSRLACRLQFVPFSMALSSPSGVATSHTSLDIRIVSHFPSTWPNKLSGPQQNNPPLGAQAMGSIAEWPQHASAKVGRARRCGTSEGGGALFPSGACLKIPSTGREAPPVRRRRSLGGVRVILAPQACRAPAAPGSLCCAMFLGRVSVTGFGIAAQ